MKMIRTGWVLAQLGRERGAKQKDEERSVDIR